MLFVWGINCVFGGWRQAGRLVCLYTVNPQRKHPGAPRLHIPGWAETKSRPSCRGRAHCPGTVNAGDLEAYWREMVGIHSPARSGPGDQSPPTLPMEMGREEHAVTLTGWPHHPTKGKTTNKPYLAILFGSCCFPVLKMEWSFLSPRWYF